KVYLVFVTLPRGLQGCGQKSFEVSHATVSRVIDAARQLLRADLAKGQGKWQRGHQRVDHVEIGIQKPETVGVAERQLDGCGEAPTKLHVHLQEVFEPRNPEENNGDPYCVQQGLEPICGRVLR